MPALGIIADDFTGAVMVAGMLETVGIACPVLFRPGAAPAAGVLIAAARTRTVPVGEALDEIAALHGALVAAGCERVAYKGCATFDSTEAGNIGPAADFLADQAGRRPVLMSAGFPRFGATVHQGFLFYRGRLVTESIKRLDPLTPMLDADLARFLGRQTLHRVGLVGHLVLRQGAGAARAALDRLAEERAGHVLFDASDDEDVEVTAEIAESTGLPVVASDPLIVALARRLAAGRGAPPPSMPGRGPAVVLAGSTGPVVLGQLAALAARHPVKVVDVTDPRAPEALAAEALDWAAGQAGPFAVSTATDEAGLAASQGVHGALGAARRAETVLGLVARGLHGRGLRRFVVAGGETSGAVVAALGLDGARALPEGRLGLGSCVTEGADPLWMYLKPGKLGAEDILLRAVTEDGDG